MVSFTSISVLIYLLAHLTAFDFVSSLAIPTTWGVATSFSVAIFLDTTVYVRMRHRRGWSLTTFVLGNLLLHFLPLFYPPPLSRSLTWRDGARASVVHISWALVESKGSFVLDDIYVPLRPCFWYICFVVSTLTELILVPLAYPMFSLPPDRPMS